MSASSRLSFARIASLAAPVAGTCRLAIIGVAVLSAGCASKGPPQSYAQVGIGRPAANSVSPPVEIEDDGLPSQSPPVWRTRVEPDDPSEPFSPNYGGTVAPVRKAAAGPASSISAPVPAASPVSASAGYVRDTASHRAIVTEDEQELIIMRAVAAHEQRRP